MMQIIYTDFQPYLVPDTDAWALSEEKAAELLDYLRSRGMRQVLCVPSVKKENPKNTPSFLSKSFERWQEKTCSSMKMKLAARYRLDEEFWSVLKEGELLPLNQGKRLLVEVSPVKEVDDVWRMLDAIVQAGYTPVVMQPERTTYWCTTDFIRLKEMGCLLMLNLYSLFGYNGDEALNYSRMLLKKEMYTYLFSGMEDTKVMRYNEQMKIEEDAELMNAVQILEKNNRLLWSVSENG